MIIIIIIIIIIVISNYDSVIVQYISLTLCMHARRGSKWWDPPCNWGPHKPQRTGKLGVVSLIPPSAFYFPVGAYHCLSKCENYKCCADADWIR